MGGAEANVGTERRDWFDSECRSRGLEKLTVRYTGQEQHPVNTEEQRQADDLTSQRFVWSARQNMDMA